MPRRRMIVCLIVLAAVLAACSSFAHTPTPAPTPVPASASPYDGDWQGQGTAQDGREITFTFKIRGGAVTSFVYNYMGVLGLECTGIDHLLIPIESQPHIQDHALSQQFGDDLTVDAAFASDTS